MKIAILHPTRHDGKRYEPGDTPDIERGAAMALVDARTAELVDTKQAAKAKAQGDADGAADKKSD